MRALMGKALLAAAGAGLVMAVVAMPAVGAQDPTTREPERRRVQIDGFGGTIGATVRDVSAEEAQRAKLSPAAVVSTTVPGTGPALTATETPAVRTMEAGSASFITASLDGMRDSN